MIDHRITQIWLLGFFAICLDGCYPKKKPKEPLPPPQATSPQSGPLQSPKAGNPSPGATKLSDIVIPTVPGTDQEVNTFKQTHVYFSGDQNNRRTVANSVLFPDERFMFSSVKLNFRLSCPRDSCDAWDRLGSLVVLDKNQKKIEILRFITPYGVGAQWEVDISDLSPILRGKRTLEVFIDTWVGPGHSQGEGWLVDASFIFKGGKQNPLPVAVIPVFEPQSIDYGDPQKPSSRSVTVTLPAGTFSTATMRSFVTGHGQGNSENCAEFCPKNHSLKVGAKSDTRQMWRADCNRTQTQGVQRGNWTPSRAGWCPGAPVKEWTIPIENPDRSLEIFYEPQAYTNARRSGYNGSSHTPPFYQESSALILYQL